MSVVTSAEAFLVDVPVETVRTDAVQAFTKQETIFVQLTTDDGLTGLGYSYTIGKGGTSVLALLRDHLLPQLHGKDSRRIEALWHSIYYSTRATATGAITSLAVASIDTALWDLRGKRNSEPLSVSAGGYGTKVPLYDTEGGWLHLSVDELVRGARASRDSGLGGVKVKVGSAHIGDDVERLRAVREAIGPDLKLMVDANQSLTLAEAKRRAAAFEPMDLYWFEEPMPADDVSAHRELVASTSIPIAVGESMYSVSQFKEYMHRGAASVIQVDVARIGGITPWLKVAHLAEAYNVSVCPHFLMELHVSLACAVPNGHFVEHIPQLRAITHTQMEIRDGMAMAPETFGLGIDWDLEAIDRMRVA
jgi:L-alanine-DL-glutamate epimerase-like enolase superfamily enzyme